MARKKKTRMRGSKTHGGGAMKKRRGKGNKGGRGRAGSGKRADQTKPSHWSAPYFGKKGFHSRSRPSKVINILDLDLKNLGKEEQGFTKIDLKGFKLLGKGKAKKKYAITVDKASAKAAAKIKAAGGSLTITEKVKKDVSLDKHTKQSA
jgi:large subunit ribosomal protein L15